MLRARHSSTGWAMKETEEGRSGPKMRSQNPGAGPGGSGTASNALEAAAEAAEEEALEAEEAAAFLPGPPPRAPPEFELDAGRGEGTAAAAGEGTPHPAAAAATTPRRRNGGLLRGCPGRKKEDAVMMMRAGAGGIRAVCLPRAGEATAVGATLGAADISIAKGALPRRPGRLSRSQWGVIQGRREIFNGARKTRIVRYFVFRGNEVWRLT